MTSKNHFRTLAFAFLFTSMSINLSFVRGKLASNREQYGARIAIVQGLVDRMRAGERVPDSEIERSRRLARGSSPAETPADRPVSWSEVVFGRKT